MYASESYSAIFCKDQSGLCDPVDLWCDCMWRWIEQIFAMLKESAAAERPWQAAVAWWCFPPGQLGWNGLVNHGNVRCPRRAFVQDILEATLSGSQSQAPSRLEVPSCNPAAIDSRPHRGPVPPAPPHRGGMYACMHIGSSELPDCILFCVPQPDVSRPLNKPLLQTGCYAKGKERTWGFPSLGVHCSTV